MIFPIILSLMFVMNVQDLLIRHLHDCMHIEKNVAETMMKIFSNAKGTRADRLAVRKELQSQNKLVDYQPRNDGSFHKAYWVWSREDMEKVLKRITSIKTPTGFVSNLANRVTSDYKLSGMKSHDYHVLLQFILPIAIRGTLSREIREGIYRLATFLRWICGKSIVTEEIPFWKVEIAEIMCLFEQCMPPHFFDIMPHLLVHLPEEVELGGPVHSRWLYFLERYMKTLKSMVRQKNYPEGSMSEGYLAQESLFYFGEMLTRLNPSGRQIWNEDMMPKPNKVILPKTRTKKKLDCDTHKQVNKHSRKLC